MLRTLEMESLIAKDESDFVSIATRLGMDPAHRREVSERILERSRRLFEQTEAVRQLQSFLEGLVGRADQ
jgi:predicted O-linked N-acetylglucosamine transferase (SPINDLY family)